MEAVGPKPVSSNQGVTAVARAVAPAAAASVPADENAAALTNVTAAAAAVPPVDTDRVARIKAAIANGSFPIYPAQIADRLIALKLEWRPHDQA